MRAEICRSEMKGRPPERVKRRWIAGLWIVTWAMGGFSTHAEILYDKDGIQLRGTAQVVQSVGGTCNVLESDTRFEEKQANHGAPMDIWRLDFSVHNGSSRWLDHLIARFQIASEWPECTNWDVSDSTEFANQFPSVLIEWGGSAGHIQETGRNVVSPGETLTDTTLMIVLRGDPEPRFSNWSLNYDFATQPTPLGTVTPVAPNESGGTPSEPAESSSSDLLPPQMRLDEYLLEAELLSEEKDHKGALEALDRVVALQKEHGLTLPEEFPYQYAQTALAAGSYQAAIDAATQYLAKAGRGGKHYREALALRVRSRRGLRAPAGADSVRRPATTSDVRGGDQVQPQVRERLPYEPEMVVIPAGEYRRGCRSDCDYFVMDNAQPVQKVRVKSFELGKYEVTFEEYDRFTSETGRERAADKGWGRGRRPVINVSWEDAVAYTRWLSQQTGARYRLPTEAEWEYAARAGTETLYSWGNQIGRNRANCIGCGSRWDGQQTAPVGSFGANGWGLHDMHGNVWEWVQDCWSDSYRGAPTDGTAWESGDCVVRVMRGGSLRNVPTGMRSAFRYWGSSSLRIYSYGFRVARTVTP